MVSCTGPILLATYQVDRHKDQNDNDDDNCYQRQKKREGKKGASCQWIYMKVVAPLSDFKWNYFWKPQIQLNQLENSPLISCCQLGFQSLLCMNYV